MSSQNSPINLSEWEALTSHTDKLRAGDLYYNSSTEEYFEVPGEDIGMPFGNARYAVLRRRVPFVQPPKAFAGVATTHVSETGIVLKDSGKRTEFATGAVRDCSVGKGRFDLLPLWALERVAKLYEAGCMKYGDRNWEKGINARNYANSGFRHLIRYIRGERDEDHLNAACWNLLCLMDTERRIELGLLGPELFDNFPKPLTSEQQAKALEKTVIAIHESHKNEV